MWSNYGRELMHHAAKHMQYFLVERTLGWVLLGAWGLLG